MTSINDENILKEYDILQRHGSGHYGVVWKAVRRRNKDLVAIKALDNDLRYQQYAEVIVVYGHVYM
jgi:serine/threonine protein kinase